jgi:manganese transport protein
VNEIEELRRLRERPLPVRLLGYFKLGGPGFMDAALTLGAGTLTAAMLSGATFGYKTLWLLWLSMGLGLFMMAAMARFTTRGYGIVPLQNRYHGWVVGSLLTALVGTAAVAVIFNFGQVSLGTHLMESLASYLGFSFPRKVNWIAYAAVTSWLTLSYGRKGRRGIRFVEWFMKGSIGVMLVAFGACLAVVGVHWGRALEGTLVPWLPPGGAGLDLFVATSAAAIGVMDWFLFNYAGLARGWGKEHEPLARFDMTFGLFIPFILVNFLVIAVFAETLRPLGLAPETAPELAKALEPLLGATWAPVLFYLGFLAVPVTTTVGMSIACAMAIHEAFGWKHDPESWRWRLAALAPQIAFVAVWHPRPLWLVIAIGAFLSLTDNIVGWSLYLLVNDERVLGEDRCRSYFWNVGLLLQVTLLNSIAIIYVLNRLGWWFS